MNWEMVGRVRVYGIPKGQPRPRAFVNKKTGRARVYDPGTAEAFKGAIALALMEAGLNDKHIMGPVLFKARIFFPFPKTLAKVVATRRVYHTSKPDCDNVMKSILDCCTSVGLWHDDAQVVSVDLVKLYADPDTAPGAVLEFFEGKESA